MEMACVWHEERFYTAGPAPWNDGELMVSWWKALGFHAVNPVRIYHTDLHNLPCIQILYKRTFDVTNQLATETICTKCDLYHG